MKIYVTVGGYHYEGFVVPSGVFETVEEAVICGLGKLEQFHDVEVYEYTLGEMDSEELAWCNGRYSKLWFEKGYKDEL